LLEEMLAEEVLVYPLVRAAAAAAAAVIV